VKQTLRRVYRKLEVNGRPQMAARLALQGLSARIAFDAPIWV
jgi:DNA-binding CsgD family transcriptional regulator